MVLPLLLCTALHGLFILEQPSSSDGVINRHWRLEWFCNKVCWVSQWQYMDRVLHGQLQFFLRSRAVVLLTSGLEAKVLDDEVWWALPQTIYDPLQSR